MKKTNKLMNWAGCAMVASGIMLTSASHAALFFWDNGSSDGLFSTAANWNPDGNPGSADLAVANNSALAPITINGNWSVDSLRISDGGSIIQTSGTLTIVNGVGPDNGLWVPESGPGPTSYTMNGGVIQINDPADGFMVARSGGSQGTFTFNAGSITNIVGDTHIGLDGLPYWYQSGGNFTGAGVQIGRFASPYALVQLSGNAVWNVGLVLLADGHGVFNPPNAGLVDLMILGSNVVFNCNGLVMQSQGQLTFDAQGVGMSAMHLGGGQFLLNGGKLFLNNLPSATATNQTIVLMDNIGSYTGTDTQFGNAPNGTIYSGGSFSWQIKYQGTNIILTSVPLCVAPSISIQPQSKSVVLNNSVTFSVGAGGSDLQYQWRTNGITIPGANSSSYTIASAQNSDGAVTYSVVVNNTCSGLSVTSSNATLTIFPPWVFYSWTDNNGTGDNLFTNANNWSPNGIPIADDFAFIGGSADSTNLLIINGDCQVDTMRTGGGTSVLHTNGTLTVRTGLWTDNGLYIGDNGDPYGDGTSRYTLNGGKIVIQDPDGFHVGSAISAVSTFSFISGVITNLAGDTHIGLDGFGTWNQTGGFFKGSGVQIGRFASTNSVVNLSSNASWDVGLVLLADGHGVFTPRNTNSIYLNITGPNVSYKSTGLVLQNEGKVTFDGVGGGISTMDFGGGQFLLNYGQLFLTNLPTVQSNGQQIVLMKNIGSYTGANTQFTNAPDGTVFGGWQLKYQGTNIALVALPIIKITNTTVSGGNVTMVFSAGTSDTTASFVVQRASVVSGPYGDVSPAATISNPSSGVFQAVTPVNGANQFYRIRRQ
jgi:nitrogen fixation protein